MTRSIEVYTAVNANVRAVGTIDLDAQALATDNGAVPGAVAAYVVATETGDSLIHKTVLTCTALPLSVADDAGIAQYGGVKVYEFPLGLIFTAAAKMSGNLTLGATGTFIDAFTGKNALGSVVATTGATLVAGEATWLQETANATAAAKVAAISSVSIATPLTETASRVFDGRTTAAPMFLNFAIADDVTHTAGTGTFTGTIEFAWMKV